MGILGVKIPYFWPFWGPSRGGVFSGNRCYSHPIWPKPVKKGPRTGPVLGPQNRGFWALPGPVQLRKSPKIGIKLAKTPRSGVWPRPQIWPFWGPQNGQFWGPSRDPLLSGMYGEPYLIWPKPLQNGVRIWVQNRVPNR